MGMSIKTQGNEVEVFWNYTYDLVSLLNGKRLSDTKETVCVLSGIADGTGKDDVIVQLLLEAISSTPDKYWKITR